MKFVQIIFLTVCIIAPASIFAAEKKEAAAQSNALSQEDATKLNDYINQYEQFKKAVLDKDMQEAISLLEKLQFLYGFTLPYNVHKALYVNIPDDEITYRLNVKPSEPTFFLQAYALLDRMQRNQEPPFPPSFISKSLPPTPPMFLSTPRKITRQFTIKPAGEDITFDITNPVKILLLKLSEQATLQVLYLITTKPNTIKGMSLDDRVSLMVKKNYAVVEYLLQNDQQLQINKDELLRYALSGNFNIPMIELLLKYGAKIDNSVQIRLSSKNIDITLPALYDLFGKEKVRQILNTAESSPFLLIYNLWPSPLKVLIDENLNLDVKNVLGLSPIELLILESMRSHDSKSLAQSLQYILESPQLTNNAALKEKLINTSNPNGLKPLCAAAEAKWKEGAKLLIQHGADCADEKYKDFLIPLIKEVEKPRAQEAGRVIRKTLPETQNIRHPLPAKVKGYIAGEEQEFVPEPTESIVSTTTGVEEAD